MLHDVFEAEIVRLGEIIDVDIVSDAAAVARVVVRAEYLHRLFRARGAQHERYEVALGAMRLADERVL